MMKRRGLLIALVVITTVLPAYAEETNEQLNVWRDITFTAPIPCSVACPHWLDVANTDIGGNGQEDVFFSACGNPDGTADQLDDVNGLPYEEGTIYDDVLVGPRPEDALVLIVDTKPTVDWDSFICANGVEMSGHGCQLGCDPECFGPVDLIGCGERAVTSVVSGRIYTLRAYNWLDLSPLRGRYCFSSTGACEEPA